MQVLSERKCGHRTYQVVKLNGGFSVYKIVGGQQVFVCGAHSERDANKVVDTILEHVMDLLLEHGLSMADLGKPIPRKGK